MATHGFIEFNYPGQEKRTLVHCRHDGYITDMLDSLIVLPFFIAFRLKKQIRIDDEKFPKYLDFQNINHKNNIYKMLTESYGGQDMTYDDGIKLLEAITPFETTENYLTEHCVDRYYTIEEPFILYGNPVKDADIIVDSDGQRIETLTINIKEEEQEQIEDVWHEYLDTINSMNEDIIDEDAKIIVNNKTIKMSLHKIICSLLVNKKV